MADLEERSLSIRPPSNDELARFESVHGKVPSNAHVSVYDTTGRRDGTFRATLRKYSKNLPMLAPGTMHIDPVMFYTGVAEKAIQQKMEQLRLANFPSYEMIGVKFVTASLTLRDGIRIFNAAECKMLHEIMDAML